VELISVRERDFISGRIYFSTFTIYIRVGNMKIKELYQTLNAIWIEVLQLSEKNKLVNVFKERIEGIN